MSYKQLFILVEGPDDERFFNNVLPEAFREKYNHIRYFKYSGWKDDKIVSFMKSIAKRSECSYLFVADINSSPCIMQKKDRIVNKYRNIDPDKIIIVVKEIESWYLAGLNKRSSSELKIRSLNTTDKITKEKFNAIIPVKFKSRIDFMIEILKLFSNETAKQKNKSFNYFSKKIKNDF